MMTGGGQNCNEEIDSVCVSSHRTCLIFNLTYMLLCNQLCNAFIGDTLGLYERMNPTTFGAFALLRIRTFVSVEDTVKITVI